MASTRWVVASAGIVLIVLGVILGAYGSMNGRYVDEKVPIAILKGVPIVFRTESVWTPSAVYWVGVVAVAAGLMSLLYAAFATEKKAKVAPEISRKALEPVPA